MKTPQQIAYEALTEWELTGELPDAETFDVVCGEQVRHERMADRYRRLVDECHHAEHLRRLPKSSSMSTEEESTPDL